MQWGNCNEPAITSDRWKMVALTVPAGLFCYFDGIPIKMALYFFITLRAFLSWLLETLLEAVVGLALPVLFLLAGVGTPQQIFSPWVGEVPLRSRRETIPLTAIADHYREMGPMSWQEKKMVVISVVLLAFLATDFLHKIPISLLFMPGAILLFVPGIELMAPKQLRRINFAILFFTTGSMSIGVAANVTGTAKWAATALAPMMQGSPT